MTLNKLCSLISKHEGKKHEASIGDIREIVSVFLTISAEMIAFNKFNELDALNKMLNEELEKKIAKIKKKRAKK